MYCFYNHTKLCESLEKNILLSGIWLHRPSQWVSLKENDVLYLIRPMTHSQHLA